jgi:hypothetical protein
MGSRSGTRWLAVGLLSVAVGLGAGLLKRRLPRPAPAAPEITQATTRTGDPTAPPKLAVWAAARGTEANAAAPDYDPVELIERHQQSVRGIFQAEPRDHVWADAMEKGLRDPLLNDLAATVPGLTDLSVECHTTTCRFHWDAHGGDDRRARHVIRMLYGGAALGNGGPNQMYVAYAGGPAFKEFKGHAPELLAKLSADRATRLPLLRAGKFSAYAYSAIPAEQWPQP